MAQHLVNLNVSVRSFSFFSHSPTFKVFRYSGQVCMFFFCVSTRAQFLFFSCSVLGFMLLLATAITVVVIIGAVVSILWHDCCKMVWKKPSIQGRKKKNDNRMLSICSFGLMHDTTRNCFDRIVRAVRVPKHGIENNEIWREKNAPERTLRREKHYYQLLLLNI